LPQKAAADATLARVRGALDYSAFGSCDMVIEAVIEVRLLLGFGRARGLSIGAELYF
jgi:hypothetical protein